MLWHAYHTQRTLASFYHQLKDGLTYWCAGCSPENIHLNALQPFTDMYTVEIGRRIRGGITVNSSARGTDEEFEDVKSEKFFVVRNVALDLCHIDWLG